MGLAEPGRPGILFGTQLFLPCHLHEIANKLAAHGIRFLAIRQAAQGLNQRQPMSRLDARRQLLQGRKAALHGCNLWRAKTLQEAVSVRRIWLACQYRQNTLLKTGFVPDLPQEWECALGW